MREEQICGEKRLCEGAHEVGSTSKISKYVAVSSSQFVTEKRDQTPKDLFLNHCGVL